MCCDNGRGPSRLVTCCLFYCALSMYMQVRLGRRGWTMLKLGLSLNGGEERSLSLG